MNRQRIIGFMPYVIHWESSSTPYKNPVESSFYWIPKCQPIQNTPRSLSSPLISWRQRTHWLSGFLFPLAKLPWRKPGRSIRWRFASWSARQKPIFSANTHKFFPKFSKLEDNRRTWVRNFAREMVCTYCSAPDLLTDRRLGPPSFFQ